MDSLIGRKVWTSFGSLRMAVITSEHKNPDFFKVTYGDGDRGTATRAMMHLTNEEAKRACEENAEYWSRQVLAMDALISVATAMCYDEQWLQEPDDGRGWKCCVCNYGGSANSWANVFCANCHRGR